MGKRSKGGVEKHAEGVRRERPLCLKAVAGAVVVVLAAGTLSGCGEEGSGISLPGSAYSSYEEGLSAVRTDSPASDYHIAAAVLYDASAASASGEAHWSDTLSYLQQSFFVNMDGTAVDVGAFGSRNSADPTGRAAGKALDLSPYDILYLDSSLAEAQDTEESGEAGDRDAGGTGNSAWKDAVTRFVENGGTVVLDNALGPFFPQEFTGLSDFREAEEAPVKLKGANVGDDLGNIQQIITMYSEIFPEYAHYEDILKESDFGLDARADGAVSLAQKGGRTLYSVNLYGKGLVFWLGGLLPNSFNISNFSLRRDSDDQLAFAHTTASCSQLLLNEIAGYAAKQRYGYALRRVFGFYGAPSASWEMHYEEETGMAHGAIAGTDTLCREYLETPSFSLVRDTYQWYSRNESITYLLNADPSGKVNPASSYQMDLNENAYSSGTHILAGDDWPRQEMIASGGSYFGDYTKYRVRAYQDVQDITGDGIPDILAGSSDGKLYYYEGIGYGERFETKKGEILRAASGGDNTAAGDEIVIPEGYSAPALGDVNGDGVTDLVSGSGNGVIYLLPGGQNHSESDSGVNDPGAAPQDSQGSDASAPSFAAPAELLQTGIEGQVLPRLCDLNGDGVSDLLVGSEKGKLYVYYGAEAAGSGGSDQSNGSSGGNLTVSFSSDRMADLSSLPAEQGLGDWLSPCVYDVNEDGVPDLVIGTGNGNLAWYAGTGSPDGTADGSGEGSADLPEGASAGAGSYVFQGFFECEERNYEGNNRIKFGNWCSPSFADLNGDGRPDLVCGNMEYGLDYSIDDAHFPWREELQEDIDYAQQNHIYVGMHYYTNEYASKEREEYEISRHLEALQSYGIDTSHMGANQHTWHLTYDNDSQSLRELCSHGILWNSGFKSSRADGDPPQLAPENAVVFPFFLEVDGEKTIFLENASTMLHRDDWIKDYCVKLKMPICAYLHTDFVYDPNDDAKGEPALRKDMEKMEELREDYGYNMCSEDKAIEASAAAYNLTAATSVDENGVLTVVPGEKSRDFRLYDADVQKAVGLEVDFREDFSSSDYVTDADVAYEENGDWFVGMNKAVRIMPEAGSGHAGPDGSLIPTMLVRINLPASIERNEKETVISFTSGGMMQVVAASSSAAESEGWTRSQCGDYAMYTKYGDADRLVLQRKAD